MSVPSHLPALNVVRLLLLLLLLSLCVQLARVLLQLRHTGPCASVCLKALTDAGRCADVAWSVQLLRLQAAALAAQEDYVGALNSCRTALAR
jgi:hypothetical protein